MSIFVGGLLAFSGGIDALKTLFEVPKNMKQGVDSLKYEPFIEKVQQVAANMLGVIGRFVLSLQLVTIGAFIYSAAPALSLWAAAAQALNASLPYLAAANGAISASILLKRE